MSQMTKKKNILLVISCIILLLLCSFIYFLYWHGNTKDIINSADQLKIPSSWKLTSEQVEPPRTICLNDIPCPYLRRDWTVQHVVTKTELAAFLSTTKNTLIENDCTETYKPNIGNDTISICSATGKIDNYQFTVYVNAPNKASASTSYVTLFMQENHANT